MAYTRTDTPRDALYALADRVPLAVVTNGGARRAWPSTRATGEEAWVPALRSPALDPTGAGDVFAAGIVLGTLARLAAAHRLAFAISARRCPCSSSAARWPRRAGATSPTGGTR